jgi:membrane dipeptidase
LSLAAAITAPCIWDAHGCPPRGAGADLLATLKRYKDAGFDAVTVNVGDSYYDLAAVMKTLAYFRHQLSRNTSTYVLVDGVDDVRTARERGKLAVSFDVEGAASLGDRLELVDVYYDLGVRWMAFAYNIGNQFGAGCHDAVDNGLTMLGRRLVERMESAGMIKCCSHTGYRTALDVFAASAKPAILSHSNPRALVDHERNVPDEVYRACAETGGVAGINGIGLFLGSDAPNADDWFRHVDYVVQLVGPEHVGIALDAVFPAHAGDDGDLDGLRTDYWPPEKGYRSGIKWLAPEVLPELIDRMRGAGYANEAIAGICGGNFLRVAEACWR